MPVIAALLVLLLALPAHAQGRASHCIAIADAAPGIAFVQEASWRAPLPDDDTVRLRYIDHAMFLLQTPGGMSAVTDYNGFLGETALVPDVVTMNHAHSTHWTARPDRRIPTILEGWGDGATPRLHLEEVGDMLVRNEPTDIRPSYGAGAERFGNSIFVFEVAGLCIGHLGHLHHAPDAAQYAALGRLDVVMAAVDGGLTVDLPTMIGVLERLESSIVIPMHWFGPQGLERFLSGIRGSFEIDRREGSEIEVSLATLPDRPTVVVLRPSLLQDE